MGLLKTCAGMWLEVPIVRNAEQRYCILRGVRDQVPYEVIKNERQMDEEDLS